MKASVIQGPQDSPTLVWAEVPDVSCDADRVMVEVHATAVNRADLLQARGLYPPPPGESEILGLEMCGLIVALGAQVTGWRIGDRVMALLPGGGYAEKVVVPPDMLMPLPDGWTFLQGAAIPEVWLTAFVNLFREGQLETGEAVLVHAGASGVGTAAIQLAAAAGAQVFATAGSEPKLEACRGFGAEMAVNYKTQDFAAEVRAATEGSGVDLILDPVGGAYVEKNLELLRENGRLVIIGLLGGRSAKVDLASVLGKSLRIIGSRLRSRPPVEKIAITAEFRKRFLPLLASGRLRPVIDSVFPIQQADAAHEYVRRNKNIGKVILKVAAT